MSADSPDRIQKADRDLFDEIACHYAQKDVAKSSSIARKGQLHAALATLLDDKDTLGTIIDIGCGVGAPARYLCGRYERYIGIDQSKELIRFAQRFHQEIPQAEFLAKDIKTSGLPANIADLILSDGALHHMIELDVVLEELKRLAKPGATLIVREPQSNNPLIQWMRFIRSKVDRGYSKDQRFFSGDDLRDLLIIHGMRNVTVEYQGFLSPPFAQVIIPPQALSVPLSRLAVKADAWLITHLPKWLHKLGFNVILTGQFEGA